MRRIAKPCLLTLDARFIPLFDARTMHLPCTTPIPRTAPLPTYRVPPHLRLLIVFAAREERRKKQILHLRPWAPKVHAHVAWRMRISCLSTGQIAWAGRFSGTDGWQVGDAVYLCDAAEGMAQRYTNGGGRCGDALYVCIYNLDGDRQLGTHSVSYIHFSLRCSPCHLWNVVGRFVEQILQCFCVQSTHPTHPTNTATMFSHIPSIYRLSVNRLSRYASPRITTVPDTRDALLFPPAITPQSGLRHHAKM
jgi:hypothetical protein